jgi:hypothetical protein
MNERTSSVEMIASTGGMTLDTVDQVVSFLNKSANIDLSLMHCIAEYPSTANNQNLAWINTLADRYHKNVGFSTHERGEEEYSGAFAYCMGASIFEKHVVSSKAETVNAYSASPDQVRRWLDRLLEAKKYVGCEDDRASLFANENKFAFPLFIQSPFPTVFTSKDHVNTLEDKLLVHACNCKRFTSLSLITNLFCWLSLQTAHLHGPWTKTKHSMLRLHVTQISSVHYLDTKSTHTWTPRF